MLRSALLVLAFVAVCVVASDDCDPIFDQVSEYVSNLRAYSSFVETNSVTGKSRFSVVADDFSLPDAGFLYKVEEIQWLGTECTGCNFTISFFNAKQSPVVMREVLDGIYSSSAEVYAGLPVDPPIASYSVPACDVTYAEGEYSYSLDSAKYFLTGHYWIVIAQDVRQGVVPTFKWAGRQTTDGATLAFLDSADHRLQCSSWNTYDNCVDDIRPGRGAAFMLKGERILADDVLFSLKNRLQSIDCPKDDIARGLENDDIAISVTLNEFSCLDGYDALAAAGVQVAVCYVDSKDHNLPNGYYDDNCDIMPIPSGTETFTLNLQGSDPKNDARGLVYVMAAFVLNGRPSYTAVLNTDDCGDCPPIFVVKI